MKKKRAKVRKLKEPVRRDTSDRTRKRKKRPTARPEVVPTPAAASPRKERRRRTRKGLSAGHIDLIYKVLLTVSLFAAVAFVSTTFFRVRTIVVSGNEVCRAEQVAAASGVQLEDRLLFVNRFEVSQGIFDALPYVNEVKIQKKFPATLHIQITEAKPAATVVSSNVAYLIDENAKLLEYSPYRPEEAVGVCIEGLTVTEPQPGKTISFTDELRLTALREVLAVFLDHPILRHIGAIQMDKLYSISFAYDKRIMVDLGDSSRLTEKLEMLDAVLEGFDGTEKGYMDVSEVTQARFLPDNHAVK